MQNQNQDLINSSKNIGINNWSIINDNVMGGVSTSRITISKKNQLVFQGNLSLENNGGFASIRLNISGKNLEDINAFEIKFRGDGKKYKLRLGQNNSRFVYSCDFQSKKNEWVVVKLPLEKFIATWRGYTYKKYADLEPEKMTSLGLLISDKQEGRFNLEIDYIKAIK
tara:strand:+ start:617 stop:1120 length:504 start_codon:yes stop_codon:yes gene_type:complete